MQNSLFFLPQQSHSEQESATDCEHYLVVLQEVRWKELTNIFWFGEYSWLHLSTQRSFLEEITPRICALSEIQVRNQLYRNCSMWLRDSLAKKSWTSRECQNWVGELRLVKGCTWWTTKRWSSSWRQQFMYSPTLYCALEKFENSQSNIEWKNRWTGMVQEH